MNRANALALALALALGGAACDASKARPIEPTAQQVDECSRCHGYPPPAFIAGGTAHTTNTQCSACHPGTVEADNVTIVPGGLHMNGVVDATGGHAMPYVAAHPAAALAGIASCTACHGSDYAGGTTGVSCNGCHADAATYPALAPGFPDWKTNCTFCHGTRTAGVTTATSKAAPPQAVVATGDQTPANPKVGAHQAHLVAGSIAGAMPCASCHDVPAPAGALTHFSGGGAPADVVFGGIATKGATSAAYTGTCNVYCHGSGTEFGSPAGKTSPAWTSTAALTCTSCHGYPPASHSAGATDCNACHPGTVDADNTTINVAGGLHVNGAKDATSAHPQDWGLASQHGYGPNGVNQTGLASCKGCHGSTLTGGSGPSCASCHDRTVANWDTSCTFCHGNRSTGRASPPVDTQNRSVTTNVSVGVHASHVGTTIAASIACDQCHPARSTSVISDPAHIDGNGVAEVSFGALARTGGVNAAYSRASATSATCSATYCHGQFPYGGTSGNGVAATVSWTSTTQVTCASCHPSSPSSREHQRHISRYGCGSCHPSYTSTTVNAALHVNGVKNVVPTNGTAVGTYNPSTRTCSAFGCHGSEVW